MSDEVTLDQMEEAAQEIMDAFDVDQPPVPIELMLERPRDGLWPRADLAELTSSFLVMTDRYSPRMSVARLLARHIARSEWGVNHGLAPIFHSKNLTNTFARVLMMPRKMVEHALESGQSEVALVNRFEVPENDYMIRMEDLGYAQE
jgi:hypothetical protein